LSTRNVCSVSFPFGPVFNLAHHVLLYRHICLFACLSEELIFDANCCRLNAFHERYMYVYTWDSRFLNIQCCAHLMRVQVPTPAGAAGNDILCMKCVSLL